MINEEKYNKSLNDNICSYEINKNLNLINNLLIFNQIKYSSYIKTKSIYQNIQNKENILKDFISNISYISFIFLSIIFINKNILSLGNFILFSSIIVYFIDPIKSILDLSESIDYIKNIYKRVNDLLLIKSVKEEETDKVIDGDICIKDLSYSPNNVDYIFDNVSFDIKKGSKFLLSRGVVVLVKSTIMKILLKYLREYKGNILINNINLKDINSNIISNSFTYISQNNYINNDTLKIILFIIEI